MEKLTGACFRLVALCALYALLEPAASGTGPFPGIRLIAGILIACCISFLLLRRSRETPAKRPILKPLALSSGFLVLATVIIDVPKYFQGFGDVLAYFLIGFLFNFARFLLMGTAIGLRYKQLQKKVPE